MEIADVDRDVEFTEREDTKRYLLAPLLYPVVITFGALVAEYCPETGAESMYAWANMGHNAAGEAIYHFIVNP